MRTIKEYVQQVQSKYSEDHPITNISLQECVDIIADNACFLNEVMFLNVDLLKKRIMTQLRSEKNPLTSQKSPLY
jgi:hypothetical protein